MLKIPSNEICRDEDCNLIGVHSHHALPKSMRAPLVKPKYLNPESEWTDCGECNAAGCRDGLRCGNCGGAGQLPPLRLWSKR